ncbi:class I SAM-dependent methyltransferase [Kribbella albertanoniae]|uniref:Class I SAM-dependent methyltransferase n=2 Tax=Kribbella albertanoniae TaxID=1266829 RepID=A0A4R4QF14_9ACTN|nr:class I SAM-dependent methyltransferase [Kribbella albertanoniae]
MPTLSSRTSGGPTVSDIELNRALWEQLVTAHSEATSDYYDVEGFLAGKSVLGEICIDEVGAVDGVDLLHLQCHFGLDSLDWARRGARVTGVDFSPAAIALARELALRAGLPATFVEADAQRLPESLDGQFDVVFASYGALCWIGDLDAWFGGAWRALRPGGRLVLVELHPISLAVDSVDPLVFGEPLTGAAPHVDRWEDSYAGGASVSQDYVAFPHGLGEIVTAAARSGLIIESLTDYVAESQEHRSDVMTRGDDGKYRLRIGGQDMPLTYALQARRQFE